MTDSERIDRLLSGHGYMVLAVVMDDGTPWAVPVRIRDHDGIKSFDWDSHLETEHSKALQARPDTAITIYEKHDTYQTGLYVVGRAELIEETKPGFGHYRFTTKRAWINDETFKKREIEL